MHAPSIPLRPSRLAVVLLFALVPRAWGADELLPLRPGMAVVTLKASLPPTVVLILDIGDIECAPGAVPGENWACPRDGNDLPNPTGSALDEWTVANLGEVFGIALDDAPNPDIYVTATHCYRGSGPSSGVVHRLDGVTGAVSVFAVLPNASQAGLGNICFDPVNRQFFVSDMEDGLIYRLGLDGAIRSTFDPFLPDDGLPGFPPLGDRAWGVAVFEDRLYFGTWTEDQTRRLASANGVWSVGIDECGEFSGAEQLELLLPNIPARSFTQPIADIAFSADGSMLLAERTMESDISSDAHNARALEYVRAGATWVPSPRIFQVGGGTDAGGGVDYAECVPDDACPAAAPHALATGDRLIGNGNGSVHGLQVFPRDGGSPATSYLIDFSPGKRGIGDVEQVRHAACRIPPGACGTTVDVAATPPACRGLPTTLDASSSSAIRCCGSLEYRFTSPTGATVSDWSSTSSVAAYDEGDWSVDVRCGILPGCASQAIVPVHPGDLPGTPLISLEEEPAPDCARPRTTLHVVEGSFGPCSDATYQWYEDGLAIPGAVGPDHVIPDAVPAGPHEYHVVVSCPEALPCGDTSPPLTVTLRDSATGPVVVLEETPAVGCARARRVLRVVPGSFGPCSLPTYAWYRDGIAIPGASAESYEIPDSDPVGVHAYHLVVGCPEELPCGDTSAPIVVTLEALPTPPQVILDETPPAGCAQPLRVLSVVPSSLGPCSVPSYQWFEDGLPIPGAIASSYVLPESVPPGRHDYVVVVDCPEDLPCGDSSPALTIVVEPLPGPPQVSVERRPAADCSRDVVILRIVPGSFGACSLPSYQWLEDGAPIAGAVADEYEVSPSTPAGWHDYVVIVSCPEGLPCGDASAPSTVLVEDPPPGPLISVLHVPGTDCVRERYVLSVVPDSFGDCSFPQYQWFQDGVALPGAVASVYEVDAALPAGTYVFHFEMTCPEALRCGSVSPAVSVTLTDFGSGVAFREIDGLLYVAKDLASDLRITWSDLGAEATSYNLYEGTIDLWYTHARKACGMPRVPAGAPTQEAVVRPRRTDAYYLLAPADCRGEGLVGHDSFGVEEPMTGIGPPCGPGP
jgi:hypothetical protein